MTDSDRRSGQQQLERHRPADDVRGSNDGRAQAAQFESVFQSQADYAIGRAGAKPRALLREQSRVVRMKSVDVLLRIDRIRDLVRIQPLGQRQLHQDAVDAGIRIQLIYERQQREAGSRARNIVGEGSDARILAALALAAHITR